MPGSHDSMIADAAKATLGPLGFRRKGRSRAWLADHGWWLIVVEFQPSAWSKGSYLNVAAHWLWSEMGTVSFDFGGRIAEHVEYLTDAQFAPAATQLAERAAKEAQRLAETFTSLSAAADVPLKEARTEILPAHLHPGWRDYNAGVAAGLVGRTEDATEMFGQILESAVPAGSTLHLAARRMMQRAADTPGLRKEVISLIERQRDLLGLQPLDAAPF